MSLKFVLKKELRWLVFLMVPFISFLIILVLTPLLFLTQSIPLLQASYNIGKKNNQFRTLYSVHEINEKILTAHLNQHYKIFQNLYSYLAGSYLNFLTIKTDTFSLNSAYKIAINSTSYDERSSMWFVPECSDYNCMNIIQQQVQDSYSDVEPFIRSLMPKNSSLSAIKTYVNMFGIAMFFQFPSKSEQDYKNISFGTFPYYFNTVISDYIEKNQSISFYLSSQNTLQLCTAVSQGFDQTPLGISCLTFDLHKLANQLLETMTMAQSDYFQVDYFLMVRQNSTNNTLNLRNFIQLNRTGAYFTSLNQSNSNNELFKFTPTIHTIIETNGPITDLYGPIIIQDGQRTDSNAVYLHSRMKFTSSELTQHTLTITQSNLTIGLISGMVILASTVAIYLAKKLLHGLDEDLIQLSSLCQYILEDDLRLQINFPMVCTEIKQIYEQVRIINKINRYSHSSYFQGHFVEKVLSYSQARKFLSSLGYDIGSLQQNLGYCYFHMGQIEKAVQHHKQSVRSSLTTIRKNFGDLQQILQCKQQQRMSKIYRQQQIRLIRKLYSLIQAQTCLLVNQKDKNTHHSLQKQILEYITLFKKIIHPEYASYPQFILVLFFQIRVHLLNGKISTAESIISKAEFLINIYNMNYAEVGKKMKEKGSKLKLLRMKNRITSHSRMHPDKLHALICYFRALILKSAQSDGWQVNAISHLLQTFRLSIFPNRLSWITVHQLQSILLKLDISPSKLQYIFAYNQLISPQIQKNFEFLDYYILSLPSYHSQPDREYVFLIDSLSISKNHSFHQNKAIFIYDKFVKSKDRISIVKFNLKKGVTIQCGLTVKESNQIILKKELEESFSDGSSYRGPLQSWQAIQTVVRRVMRLQNQKIITVFWQSISKYQQSIRKRQKRQEPAMQLGSKLLILIKQTGLTNCQFCFFCHPQDQLQHFRSFFGLQSINSKLRPYKNTVYLLDHNHKQDIQRVLSRRSYVIPDNHIFVL